MANLIFSDKIFADSRFQLFCQKVGGMDHAVGKLVRLWLLAQRHWKYDKGHIPCEEFERGDWYDCLTVGLVRKTAEGYYASGSEEMFKWIYDKMQNSKKGVEERARRRAEKEAKNEPIGQPIGKAIGQPLGEPQGQPLILNLLDNKLSSIPPSADAFGEVIFEVSKNWLSYAVAHMPSLKGKANCTHERFAAQLAKVCKVLSITPEQLREMFAFIAEDTFWAKNAISPFGLLQNSKNGLRKAENVLNAMKKSPTVSGSQPDLKIDSVRSLKRERD